jgi:PAS domain S-box-containing protein
MSKRAARIPLSGERTGAPAIVLIVEDDEGLNRLIAKCLNRDGFKTESAFTGQEVLSKADGEADKILLLDYHLPDMSAMELLDHMGKSGCVPPFVIMTGYGDEDIAVDMMKRGAVDYIGKEKNFINLLPQKMKRACEQVAQQRKLALAEEALRTSEELHRTLLDISPDEVTVTDLEGRIQNISKRTLLMHGFETAEEVIGKNALDLIVPEDRKKAERNIRKTFEKGFVSHVEYDLLRKDGSRFTGELSASLLKDKEGKPIGYVGVTRDITQRKRFEKRQALHARILDILNRSNEWKALVNDLLFVIKEFIDFEAVAIRLRDGDDFPYYVVNGFPASFVEKERFLCIQGKDGKPVRDSEGAPSLACMCGRVITGGADPSMPVFTKGGSFWTNSTTKLIEEAGAGDLLAGTRNTCNIEGYESLALIPLKVDSQTVGLLQLNDRKENRFDPEMIEFFEAIGNSIGIAIKRKQTEEQIQKELKEKEVLLHEIHHRVKNNLQIITSLLRLQSQEVINEQDREKFQICQNRIKAMALIHEKLYESSSLAQIDFSDYVKKMISHLRAIYRRLNDRVKFNIDVKDICLGIDQAIPGGLIINELLTNAMKHGFADGREGAISVSMRANKGNKYRLVVEDTGVGIPEGYDYRNPKSLGMSIVADLVRQIGGTIELKRVPGTAVVISF